MSESSLVKGAVNRLTDVKSYTSGGTLTQWIHYTYDVADRLIGRQIETNGDGTYDPPARRMGVRTADEICQERYALMALRGDFGKALGKAPASAAPAPSHVQRTREVIDLVTR